MSDVATDEVEDRMLRAIGFVIVEGSFLASELQGFAKSLADSELVADLLADVPLGGQVRQVRRLLAAVRAREQFDPVLGDQIDRVLRTLDGPLIRRRNDVAHGLWGTYEGTPHDDEPADMILCSRLTPSGIVEITTTIRSLNHIGEALRLAQNALIHAGSWRTLQLPRWAAERDLLTSFGYWDPERAVTGLIGAVREMENGTADGWLWRTSMHSHLKAAGDEYAPESAGIDGIGLDDSGPTDHDS